MAVFRLCLLIVVSVAVLHGVAGGSLRLKRQNFNERRLGRQGQWNQGQGQWNQGQGNQGQWNRPNFPSRPNFQGPPDYPVQPDYPGQPDYEDPQFTFDRNPPTQRPPGGQPGGGRPGGGRPGGGRPGGGQPGGGRPGGAATTISDLDITTPTTGTTFANCNCPTTPEFNPVCGKDRVTYSNASRLRCANLCGYRVEIDHQGACIAITTPRAVTVAFRRG